MPDPWSSYSPICEECKVWSVKCVKSDLWNMWSLICEVAEVWSVKNAKSDLSSMSSVISEVVEVWSVKNAKSDRWNMWSLICEACKVYLWSRWSLIPGLTPHSDNWSGDQPMWHCATGQVTNPYDIAPPPFDRCRGWSLQRVSTVLAKKVEKAGKSLGCDDITIHHVQNVTTTSNTAALNGRGEN